jgi:hypothetical protein
MVVQETEKGAEIGRETIGGIGISTMRVLKRKAEIGIGIGIDTMIIL